MACKSLKEILLTTNPSFSTSKCNMKTNENFGLEETLTKNLLLHLLELRRRFIHCLVFFILFFILFYYFSDALIGLIIKPLLTILPDKNLISTQITSGFFIPIDIAFKMTLLCVTPLVLFQLLFFAKPGLYQQEKYHLFILLGGSIGFFFCGLLFCFYFILPWMFYFLVHAKLSYITLLPDISYTLNFTLHMLLVFGICFELPIFCLILAKIGLLHTKNLKKIRPYAIVSAFIIGMLLTPPDVLSQLMLAIPICLLFEVGIFFVWLFEKKGQKIPIQNA